MRLATTRAQLLDLTTLATGVAAAPTVAILNFGFENNRLNRNKNRAEDLTTLATSTE
ncbi:hypothetical protein GBA52_004546 [Prunus armeniaca]|nr:hypothetical protein GBA52_004546 [Prunus armeniaca]